MADAAIQRAIDHADLARDAADDAKTIAVRAEAKIDSHDRVCSERYLRILQNQERADGERASLGDKVDALAGKVDANAVRVSEGFREFRGVLIKAAFAILGALLGLVMMMGKFFVTLAERALPHWPT